MTDKPKLNLIKEEDCKVGSVKVGGGIMNSPWISMLNANQIIQAHHDKEQEKFKVRYCRVDSDSDPIDIGYFRNRDTHKITYKVEPLEEEKVECDHRFEIVFNDLTHNMTAANYCKCCPKCGEKLKE